jgi:tripartite motif-containing protein 2/3/tripartite motif-containing protein 71
VDGEHIKESPFNVCMMNTPVPLINTISGLKGSCGVAVNKRGEIIVAERGGHCISVFSRTGNRSQSFGLEGSGPGQFNEPSGVTVDDHGNILVADTSNHRIQKFTSDNIITSVGSHGSNHLQFMSPVSVSISPITKKIAISDWNNHQVQIFHPDLTFHSSIGSKGSSNGQFNRPHDTAFDSARELKHPCGITVDYNGVIYVTDSGNSRIQIFFIFVH